MIDRRSFFAAALAAAWGACVLVGPARAAADTPKQFVREVVDQTIEVLKLPIENKAEREARFRDLLLRDFDMPVITRLVLGRHWRKATPEQKAHFSKVFETHIVKVYTTQLGAYDNQVVEIQKSAPLTEKDTVIYTLVMHGDDPPLRLDWRVRHTDHGLKILDVAAEGVSLLTTKRSEFTSVIAHEGSVDALISRLEELNAQADASADAS